MVGMSCLDQFWQVAQFPPQHSRTPTTRYRTQGGGPAATAAVAAARLGAQVSLWSFHGDDANGHALKDELGRHGVDISCIPAVEGAITPVSAVLGTEAGERYIFPYRDAGLAGLGADWDVGDLASFGCVLADVRYPRLSKRVLEEAERCGTPTVGDFGDASEWSLARFVTHLIVSEECAQAILGDTWDIACDVERLEPALARLRQGKGQTVGITLGERGFVYDAGEGMQHIPAFPAEVVDTTGAGDVFHGAYAYALACGWTPEGCARFASGAAALACQGVGREALPKLNDVLTLLGTHAEMR
jgi:sulfofructose kinase